MYSFKHFRVIDSLGRVQIIRMARGLLCDIKWYMYLSIHVKVNLINGLLPSFITNNFVV